MAAHNTNLPSTVRVLVLVLPTVSACHALRVAKRTARLARVRVHPTICASGAGSVGGCRAVGIHILPRSTRLPTNVADSMLHIGALHTADRARRLTCMQPRTKNRNKRWTETSRQPTSSYSPSKQVLHGKHS
eukprot:3114773-Rhodomonas_salina.1